MAFEPDILITTPDGVTLVIEAKVFVPNLERTEEDLKQYMVRMQCPIGLFDHAGTHVALSGFLHRTITTVRSACR